MAGKRSLSQFPIPPEASPKTRQAALRVRAPVEKFLHNQTSSGFVLVAMAVVALVWANSPWHHSYHHLWHETYFTIDVGGFGLSEPLHFWVNDFLMTFFFMVVGFEIKREMAEGELSDMRRAALPIAAALGGMLVPAGIYVAFNPSGPTADGWGVPMATDIAFALGIMVLLGSRVPAALRILLLALAIIDDIGAILVIAIFYSSNFNPVGLGVVAVGCVILILFIRAGIRPGWIYMVPLLVIWTGLHEAGIHATLAGVIVGLAAPVKPWLSHEQFMGIARRSIDEFQDRSADRDANEDALLAPLSRLTLAGREAVSPVVRLQNAFHTWSAFFIMPIFALANAGVNLGTLNFESTGATAVMLGVALGLVVGKPLGVLLISWIMIRLGWASLPRGVTWGGMLVLGLCAGIGFTMAIFIAELGFKGMDDTLALGKLAILLASFAAAVLGLILGRMLLPSQLAPDVAAVSEAEAEASTEY